MLSSKAELLEESSCEFNKRKERICQNVDPGGNGVGGCAFDGAQIVLVPITDAAHLVHAPSACMGNSWNTRGSLSSGSLLYKRCFTTDLSENDIVFGSEDKLRRSIEYIATRYSPSAIFVYSTCVTALIGEDIGHVCRTAAKKTGIPVIPVESPGFAGSKNFGNRLAGEVLLEHVIGSEEPVNSTPYDINLIGEYNIAGELWNIVKLLKKLGVRVSATITGDSTYKQIASCHRARLNVMVCSRALINIAGAMKDKYGIPYLEECFFGIENTSTALKNIAGQLGGRELKIRVGWLIRLEKNLLEKELSSYKTSLEGKRIILYTGGVKSWSVISALQDLGMEVIACGTRKSTPDDIARMKELLGKDALLLKDSGPPVLVRLAKELQADMMVAGGRNQYTALKAKIPYLDINQEREHPYTGYEGMANFARMLDITLSSPVWAKVRRNPPW